MRSRVQAICKAAGKFLTPFATDLILQLLQSQSELEPASLNYLAFHVEKSGISQEKVGCRLGGWAFVFCVLFMSTVCTCRGR